MSQQTSVTLIDDIDGSEAEESIEFGLDGVGYRIDLSGKNARRLRDGLAEFVEHARRIRGHKRTRSGESTKSVGREQNKAIRAWARDNGFDVSSRGRLPTEVTTAFHQRP